MDKIKNYILGLISGIVAIIFVYKKGKTNGKEEQEAKINEKIVENIKKVKSARNDSNKLAGVRKKYTRK